MKRTRYIRIFVSSTFVDTTIERNILSDIEEELSVYVGKRGWTLEMVDLRWGVTRENGILNQTVKVCLDEIDRCMELSPKPNFLFLLGNRYGWRPLPEELSDDILPIIRQVATQNELALLREWYIEDTNMFFDSFERYGLKGRDGRYLDDKIFEEEVYKPLREVFDRVVEASSSEELRTKYCSSATELEINHAIFDHDNDSHVLGYFRHLNDIPSEAQECFCDGDNPRLKDIKAKIKSVVPDNQYIDDGPISFKEYCTESVDKDSNIHYIATEQYRQYFYSRMLGMLKDFLDNVIKENETTELEYEISQHQTALELAGKNYIDRHETCSEILKWFFNKTEVSVNEAKLQKHAYKDVLWLYGEPGSGKTALLSDIVSFLKEEGIKVCYRNIGLTDKSSDIVSSLQSIKEELGIKELNEIKDPTLIIFDGAVNFGGLPNNFIPNLKYIYASSHHKPERDTHPHIIKEVLLPHMSIYELNQISYMTVLDSGRYFSVIDSDMINNIPEEYRLPRNIIEMTKFTLLPSWKLDMIKSLPHTISGIMQTHIEKLVHSEGFNQELILFALSLFHIDRQGFLTSELNCVFAYDEGIYQNFVENGLHEWKQNDIKKLPPAIWLRLSHKIQQYVSLVHYKSGMRFGFLNKQYDDAAIEIINSKDEGMIRRALVALSSYYEQKVQHHDAHALLELPYILMQLYKNSTGEERKETLSKICHYILSWQYVREYLTYAKPQDLSADILNFLLQTEMPYDKRLFLEEIGEEIRCMVNAYTEKDFISALLNSPIKGGLYKSLKGNIPEEYYFKDILAEYDWCNYDNFSVKENGEVIAISDDGSLILQKEKDNRTICIYDVQKNIAVKRLTFQKDVTKIVTSSDFNYWLAVLDDVSVVLLDVEKCEYIWHRSAPKGVRWITMSSDAKTWAFGGGEQTFVIKNGKETYYNFSWIDGKLSPTGNILWLLEDDYLTKIYTQDLEQASCDLHLMYKDEYKVERLLAGNDELVVLSFAQKCVSILYCHADNSISRKGYDGNFNTAVINSDTKSISLFNEQGEYLCCDYTSCSPTLRYFEYITEYKVLSPNGFWGYDQDTHSIDNLQIRHKRLPWMRQTDGYVSASDDGKLIGVNFREPNTLGWAQIIMMFRDGYIPHYVPVEINGESPLAIMVSHDGTHIAIHMQTHTGAETETEKIHLFRLVDLNAGKWDVSPIDTVLLNNDDWQAQTRETWPHLFQLRPNTEKMDYYADASINGEYPWWLPTIAQDIYVERNRFNDRIPTGEEFGIEMDDCLIVIPSKVSRNVYVVHKNYYPNKKESTHISLINPFTKETIKMFNCPGIPGGFQQTNDGLVFITAGYGMSYIKEV